MQQIKHSISGDNNLVQFHLRQKETVIKREVACRYCVQGCLKILLLLFTFMKMHGTSKSDQFSEEDSRNSS